MYHIMLTRKATAATRTHNLLAAMAFKDMTREEILHSRWLAARRDSCTSSRGRIGPCSTLVLVGTIPPW